MSEEMLVRHCSPTLAGLKSGSLFSCPCPHLPSLTRQIRALNRRLVGNGLRIVLLRVGGGTALIYVYRPQLLRQCLSCPQAAALLSRFGYSGNAERCIVRLIQRLQQQADFPHEIGLFLGYPAEDVQGFIECGPRCCKCVGCWKVYGDVAAAQRCFARYRKCTQEYCRHYQRGSSLEKLTVATRGERS